MDYQPNDTYLAGALCNSAFAWLGTGAVRATYSNSCMLAISEWGLLQAGRRVTKCAML